MSIKSYFCAEMAVSGGLTSCDRVLVSILLRGRNYVIFGPRSDFAGFKCWKRSLVCKSLLSLFLSLAQLSWVLKTWMLWLSEPTQHLLAMPSLILLMTSQTLLTIYASDETFESFLMCVLLAVKVIPWVEFAVPWSSNNTQKHLFQRFVQGQRWR